MNNPHLVPTRKAPTLQDALRTQKSNKEKKKPPPRPPPPNFAKIRSKSAWNLTQQDHAINLIEWSPPSSPKHQNKFNGSISSSYSSSTSSLASSKKSFEGESTQYDWLQVAGSTFYQKPKVGPTIIRPQVKKVSKLSSGRSSASTSRDVSPLPPFLAPLAAKLSPPMPNIPPPSPPKVLKEDQSICVEPFGIALYDYASDQRGDLVLQADDIVYLLRSVNDDWFYGRVDDREGMFPKNYVDIQIPLKNITSASNKHPGMIVQAIFDFQGQVDGDLSFHAGDTIRVERVIDNNWLYGECNGSMGQFPTNFVNRISQS